MTTPSKVNLAAGFAKIPGPWQPHLAGQVNGTAIKLAKLEGEFVWHHHEHEDELFLVLKGRLVMRFRDKDVEMLPGEMLVVPKGVEHLPIGYDGCEVMLVEPMTTLNTGNLVNERTVEVKPL